MPVNGKAKGSRNERKTMRLLESAGYQCTKSGASLGCWDVLGIGKTDFVCVQVKSNRLPSPAEREVLQAFPCPPNTKKLIHVWEDRKKLPRVIEL